MQLHTSLAVKEFVKGYFINSINCFRGGGIKREKEHCACQPESHQ